MHHGKQLPNRLKIQKEQQTTLRIHTLHIFFFSQEQFSSHRADKCTKPQPFKQENGTE